MTGIERFFRGRQVPKSDGGLSKAVGQVLKKPAAPQVNSPSAAKTEPVVTESADTPWMRIARAEIGVKEVPGSGSNPRIQEYHSVTKGGASPDATPWCASFANWVLYKAGIRGTGTKWARDFLNWGEPLDKPRYGCIAIYERNGPGGDSHVCFWSEAGESYDHCLGGNQDNAVNVKPQLRSRLLGYRWPRPSDYVNQAPHTPEDYARKYAEAKVRVDKLSTVANRTKDLLKFKESHYEPVAKIVGCPWYVVATIHNQENGSDVGVFKAVLHNGEKIVGTGRKTVLVPRGRGPFATWQDAAVDALGGPGALANLKWDIGHTLQFQEKFNGMGYNRRGIPSPYIWAMTDQYSKGHYVADGKFDPEAVSKNYGVAAIYKALGVDA